MKWFIITILFAFAQLASCDDYENVKDLANEFKSVVDSSIPKNISKMRDLAGGLIPFAKKLIPFAELTATSLKVQLEDDKLENLIVLTKEINSKAMNMSRQFRYMENLVAYRDLILNYREKVNTPIMFLLDQIKTMTHLRINVSEITIRTFAHECQSINSPRMIARHLSTFVEYCTNSKLNIPILVELHNIVDMFEYNKYEMSKKDKDVFNHRLAVLYFYLAARYSDRELSIIRRFCQENKSKSYENKAELLKALMDKLGIGDQILVDTFCFPIAAFLASGYHSDSITYFASSFIDTLYSLGYPGETDYFIREVNSELEPVIAFASGWFEKLLESTWPEVESVLIENLINDASKGTDIQESNITYQDIADKIYIEMEPIGQTGYSRNYLITHARVRGYDSMEFKYSCLPNMCTLSTSRGVNCVVFRVDTKNAIEKVENLIKFANNSYPLYFNAMDKELYRFYYVETVVKILGDKYHLDLENYTNHSGYAVLRTYQYLAGCSNAFAIKSMEYLEYNFLQVWPYHTDGSIFTNCQDW